MRMRLLLGGVALCLFVGAILTFYNFASSPTDENIFTDLPGKLYVLQTHSDIEGVWKPEGKESVRLGKTWRDWLRAGDLIHDVNGLALEHLADFTRILRRTPPDSTLVLHTDRPAEQASGEFHVRRREIPDSLLPDRFLMEQGDAVVVTSVTEGGASDRAGMRPGDVIVRINGQSFTGAFEADKILRRAQIGREFTYEVIRGTERLTLTVVLARFGFPVSILFLSLSGIVFLGTGAFISLSKPKLKAARLLGLHLILLGFVIAVAMIRREPDVTFFVGARGIAWIFSIFFGFATGWHARLYFPQERPEILARKWIIPSVYLSALVLSTVMVYLGTVHKLDGLPGLIALAAGVMVLALYAKALRFPFRKQRSKLYAEQCRLIRITGILVASLTIALILVLSLTKLGNQIGFIGLPLVLIPLAYLYTIGRYRLLDMNLRIRRNIQYTLVSVGWNLICAAALVFVFSLLINARVKVIDVAIHGTSIEVSDAPPPGIGGGAERLLFMLLAMGSWYALWKIRKWGQRLIDERYYRKRYDYRKALGELSGMLASKLSMTSLGKGIVEKLVELMQLKRAAVYFFRDQKVCCCQEAFGVDPETWKQFCLSDVRDLVPAMQEFSGAFNVDYLPERLKQMFRNQEFRYVVPIRSKARLIGALLLGEKLSESPFGQEDQDFLSSAAMQASVSIENAFLYEELSEQERMKQELDIARRIQLASLPQGVPAIAGLDIAGRSLPAMEVGGDFYDYLNGKGDAVTVIVGDVSGKGTSAALYMSKVQGILRSLHGFVPSPASLLMQANRLLSGDLERSSFVTVFGAAVDPATHTAVLARAGHLPVYVYRGSTGAVERLVTRGVGLGLSDEKLFDTELEEKTISYAAGDILLLVTDGIVEARNTEGEEYGEDRLQEMLRQHARTGAADLRDRILDEVKAFAGSASQHDDQTVVVVKGV